MGNLPADLVTRIRGKLLAFWIGEHAEAEARRLLTEAADYIEDILTKDRLKTREINILTPENKSLRAALVSIVDSYDRYRGRGGCPAPNEYQNMVDTINAARRALDVGEKL
jgi:hypothetical protein